jgi:ABC-type dipeptide/oligopeptide/nickel transport system permease component
MRVLGIIIIILGLVGVVFGALFLPMASSAEQAVADSIAPKLTIDKVDATYEQLDAAVKQMKGDEPAYLATYAQKVGVALAKANLGTAKLVRYLGILSLCLGVGVAAAGVVLTFKK